MIIKYKNPVNEQVNEETFIKDHYSIKNIIGYRYYQSVDNGIDKLEKITIKVDKNGESEGVIYPLGLLSKLLFTFSNKTAYLSGFNHYNIEENFNNKRLLIKSFLKLITVQIIFLIPTAFIISRIISELVSTFTITGLLIPVLLLIYMIYINYGADVRILINKGYNKISK